MGLWRYTAIDQTGTTRLPKRKGELSGETAAEVRAALRRIGLQVVDLQPIKRRDERATNPWLRTIRRCADRHLASRRRPLRAEMYDSLATMLESGIPLLEAIQTMLGAAEQRSVLNIPSARRQMLAGIRDQLGNGSALDNAMEDHPSWFQTTEIAMVRAGQHSGNLAEVCRSLARQHERSGEIGQKLIAALAYPLLLTLVGIGVVVFLSVKTLPELVGILNDADIATPALTRHVMATGQFIAAHWLVLVLALAAAPAVFALGRSALHTLLPTDQARGRWSFLPRVVRRIAVGNAAIRLTDLIRSGVPVVESLRVVSPTVPSVRLRDQFLQAADRIERGEEFGTALDDPRWFDAEFRRLLEIGQSSGELEQLLERIGERYLREARRLIDQLAALLEPCVLLVLAFLVGLVVMAAILPMLQLKEVL